MRIAIFGSGGVGGYFGARLAAAGHDVHFIARGAHLAAMRSRGLRVESTLGNVHVPQPQAHTDSAEIGAVDFVLFAVKLADVASAAERLPPLLAERTRVLCFQNGVEAPEIVARVIGAKHVLPGVAYIATAIAEPGVVRHTGTMQRLQVGAAAEAFIEACKAAGITIEKVDDVERARWEKFVFLEALSGVTTLARAPVGVCRADPELRATLAAAMSEAWRVGRSRGVHLPDDFIAERLKFVDRLHADMRTSMQHDLEVGKPLEAPWLCGAVVRMCAETGLAAPVNRTIYAALKPYLHGSARATH
ncbi:MAG: 2-dehydropantoate 2-reductase [Betaproteobacteria bacterium]|nr:MAG: 2-dehydropantoate 2-reductase [Betaproteobacteria bacterium]